MNYRELKAFAATFEALAQNKPYYVGKSRISGNGLIAGKDIPKGASIGVVVEGGPGQITNMGSMLNHQTNCNARLVENANDGCDLIALKDIPKDTEITVDYKDTPWYIDKNTEGFLELE